MRAEKRATEPMPLHASGSEKPEGYYQMFNRTLASMFPEEATTILDVGCATGVMGAFLKENRPDRRVYGVEVVPSVAAKARERLDEVIVGDVQALFPIAKWKATFDVIAFGDVLEHLTDPASVLERTRPMLAPTGQILVCVPNVAHWSVIGELLQGRFPYAEAGILDATHFRFFTPGSFRAVLEDCGYEVLQELSHTLPNDSITRALAEAAARIGIDPAIPIAVTPVYQQLYRARPRSAVRPPLAVVTGRGDEPTTPASPTVSLSVILITDDAMDHLPECLETVRSELGMQDQIVVVDRGSRDGTGEYVAKIAESELRLSAWFDHDRTSFGDVLEHALTMARGETVVVLDPHYQVFPGWREGLLRHFTTTEVAMVVANSDGALAEQNVSHYIPKGTTGDFDFASFAAHLARENAGKVRMVPCVQPFFFAMPRRIWQRVGRFESDMSPLVTLMDYSWRCRREGLTLFCAADVFVRRLDPSPVEEPDLPSIRRLRAKLEAFYGPGSVPQEETLFGSLALSPADVPEPALAIAPGDTRGLYLDAVKRSLTNWIYGEHEPQRWNPLDRLTGRDWPPSSWAHTMIGWRRLDNLQACVETVLRERIPGDLLEAGVWRGGASILMRAILKAYGDTERCVWVADSFEGLPHPDPQKYPADAGDIHHTYGFLAVELDEVRSNFQRHGLLDEQVRFLKGWFKDTLPSAPAETYAVLRLDGDMYESTMDALVHLYPKLAPGGYLIVDDYGAIPACRKAVEDYRRENGVNEPILPIDWTGAYWRKRKEP